MNEQVFASRPSKKSKKDYTCLRCEAHGRITKKKGHKCLEGVRCRQDCIACKCVKKIRQLQRHASFLKEQIHIGNIGQNLGVESGKTDLVQRFEKLQSSNATLGFDKVPTTKSLRDMGQASQSKKIASIYSDAKQQLCSTSKSSTNSGALSLNQSSGPIRPTGENLSSHVLQRP